MLILDFKNNILGDGSLDIIEGRKGVFIFDRSFIDNIWYDFWVIVEYRMRLEFFLLIIRFFINIFIEVCSIFWDTGSMFRFWSIVSCGDNLYIRFLDFSIICLFREFIIGFSNVGFFWSLENIFSMFMLDIFWIR